MSNNKKWVLKIKDEVLGQFNQRQEATNYLQQMINNSHLSKPELKDSRIIKIKLA